MNANRYMRDSLRTADRSNMDRLNPLAKKYADIPFRTFYVHPKNGCFLEASALRGEQLEKWNNRNA